MPHLLKRNSINIDGLHALAGKEGGIILDAELKKSVQRCRKFLEQRIAKPGEVIYGVNTGFGSLCDTMISPDAISELQVNLVMSHACGCGDEVPGEISRLMLLLKIINLSLGHSGIRTETLDFLIAMYNKGLTPVIYEMGSLGASGDLVPLAHLSLPLLGKGEVRYKGEKVPSSVALKKAGMKALKLEAKEGLALLNGTQFMSAYSVYILGELKRLMSHTDVVTAMSVDAFDCLPAPFSSEVHQARPHPGQVFAAKSIRNLLKDSAIFRRKKEYVQDPYSFRCIPQVHGASIDAIEHVRTVVEREISSVTDNPMIFPEEEKILSAGNFHGQPLALSLDFLAIAISELASISERRIYKLISGQRGLPPFLTRDAGLHSGMMIPQYTAASLVSQNKQLCTPASVDSIDSSNGQEDHVSMGANAALKCLRILKNYRAVLSIELMTAARAIHFRRPLKSSKAIEDYLLKYRKLVPYREGDDTWYIHMRQTEEFLRG